MEWLLTFFSLLLHMIFYICRAFYTIFYWRKPASVSKPTNPLLQLSAITLAKGIREGQITSQAAVEAYIERIKEVNPFINSVVEDRFEQAILDAKTCDAKLKSGEVNEIILKEKQPLYGVPITVKESCKVKDLSYTGCTIAREGIKASEDGAAVKALRNAGAIPLCVTNTPELCASLNTSNRLFGRTCNPYDKRMSAGGSSGGEGAIIGAGASLLGIGSDYAGSIRVPALFNGIFGHKPTPGIIPIEGHWPMSDDPVFRTCLTLGPLARYADDLHLAVKLLTAQSGLDLRLDDPVDIKKLRVFSLDRVNSFLGLRIPNSETRETVYAGTNYLVESGAQQCELPKFLLKDICDISIGVIMSVSSPPLLQDKNDPNHVQSAILELLKFIVGKSTHTFDAIMMQNVINAHGFIPASRRERYVIACEDIRQKLINLLKDDGVVILPTFVMPACFHKLMGFLIDCGVYCLMGNILRFPSTHVPMGFNKDGVPIGFQVMAGPNQDRLCLAVAKSLEKKFGGWIPPSSN